MSKEVHHTNQFDSDLLQLQDTDHCRVHNYNRLLHRILLQNEAIEELHQKVHKLQADSTSEFPDSNRTFQSFTGEDLELPFAEWLYNWELFANGQCWDVPLKLLKFPCYLAGDALDFYRCLGPEIKQNYKQLHEHFSCQYDTRETAYYFKTKFYNRKMGTNETVAQYAHDMRRLARGAFPSGHSDLFFWFIEGLPDTLKERVKDRDPTDFDTALTIAKKLEARCQARPIHKVGALQSDVLAGSQHRQPAQFRDMELLYTAQTEPAAAQPNLRKQTSCSLNYLENWPSPDIIQGFQDGQAKQKQQFEQRLVQVTTPCVQTVTLFSPDTEWHENPLPCRTKQNLSGSQSNRHCDGFNQSCSSSSQKKNYCSWQNGTRGMNRLSSGSFVVPGGNSGCFVQARPPVLPRQSSKTSSVHLAAANCASTNAESTSSTVERLTDRILETGAQLQSQSFSTSLHSSSKQNCMKQRIIQTSQITGDSIPVKVVCGSTSLLQPAVSSNMTTTVPIVSSEATAITVTVQQKVQSDVSVIQTEQCSYITVPVAHPPGTGQELLELTQLQICCEFLDLESKRLHIANQLEHQECSLAMEKDTKCSENSNVPQSNEETKKYFQCFSEYVEEWTQVQTFVKPQSSLLKALVEWSFYFNIALLMAYFLNGVGRMLQSFSNNCGSLQMCCCMEGLVFCDGLSKESPASNRHRKKTTVAVN